MLAGILQDVTDIYTLNFGEPVMDTELISAITPLDNDAALLQSLEEAVNPEHGGSDMVIGLRNQEGKLYRRITVSGMGNFLGAIEALTGSGMTDELEHAFGMREGCDAIFSMA